jgi:hypothetical protein
MWIVEKIWFAYRNFVSVQNKNINAYRDHDVSQRKQVSWNRILQVGFQVFLLFNERDEYLSFIVNPVRRTSASACIGRNPCENHALCQDQPDGSYTCLCTFGWTGQYCNESKIRWSWIDLKLSKFDESFEERSIEY